MVLIRSGDRKAGERLAVRWHPRLMRTARRLLGDDEQARDAVQETWAGVFRGWSRLADPARFPPWVYGILHRKCADRIGAAQRHRATFSDDDQAPSAPINPQAEDALALSQAFMSLAAPHRAAAILFFSEGLTVAEIAEALAIPVGTAKSRIFNAKRHLRKILKGDSSV